MLNNHRLKNTMKFNLLIGLPGSGKTTWLKENANPEFSLDDISQTDKTLKQLKHIISLNPKEIWIADINFCDYSTLLKAQEKIKKLSQNSTFNFLIFPKTKEECLENVKQRNDGRLVNNTIEIFYNKSIETFSTLNKTKPEHTSKIIWSENTATRKFDI